MDRAGHAARMTGRHDAYLRLTHRGAMSYRRESTAVLAMWRNIERQMVAAPPDSPDLDRLIEEWARLRLEYGRLIDLAAERDGSTTRSWPTAASHADPKRELADRSSELLDELEHLKETEGLKRREPISTGPFHELGDEVTASIERVRELGAESETLGDEAETGTVSIEDVEAQGTRTHS